MTAKIPHEDKLKSKPTTKAYDKGWDHIWKKKVKIFRRTWEQRKKHKLYSVVVVMEKKGWRKRHTGWIASGPSS